MPYVTRRLVTYEDKALRTYTSLKKNGSHRILAGFSENGKGKHWTLN